MGLKKRFNELIEKVATHDEGKMNNMLKPNFIDADEETQTSVISFPYQNWACNQRGEIHGGGIAAMFDTAIGATSVVFLGKHVATADLHVSYIRPFTGDEFLFETKINNLGNMLVRASCVAKDAETKKVLATATATFVPVDK